MKEIIYITEWVKEINRWENTIEIVLFDNKKRAVPINIIDSIYILTDLKISTKILELLNQYGITIYFHNYYWWYIWSFFPKENKSSWSIIIKQSNVFIDKWLELSIKLMEASFYNMLKVLDRYKDRTWEQNILYLKEIYKNLRFYKINCIDDLMWYEWTFRRIYYEEFSKCILNKNIEFNERNRQPPRDLVNFLISLLNSSLYNFTNDTIIKSQLSPFISFYHSINYKRYSLCLDISEVFKPILVDRCILNLLNNNILDENVFSFNEEKLEWDISKDVIKKVFSYYKKWLEETVKVKKLERNYSFWYLITLDCYKLIKYLLEWEDFDFYKLYN